MRKKVSLLFMLFLLAAHPFSFAQQSGDPFFEDGEGVNFIGNSITHGTSYHGRFHNYVFLFYATRFPNEKVAFYNSGKWGDNANSFLQRMDDDILSSNADWSVVMAGMNDVNRLLYRPGSESDPDIETRRARALSDYRGYMRQVIQKLQAAGTRVILQKPSIYDQTGTFSTESWFGVNDALQECTLIIDELAQEFQLKTVDYFTILNELNLQIQEVDPTATLISNDRIHPHSQGNFVMAYQFLKETNAPKYVANIQIADNAVKGCDNCQLSDLNISEGQISFNYTAHSLPFPVADDAAGVLSLIPFSEELNTELLKVEDLAPGNYTLSINGTYIESFTNQELTSGVNLALHRNTPQYKQAQQVMAKTDAYKEQQVVLRDIVYVEYNVLDPSVRNDYNAAKAYLDSLKAANSTKYTHNKQRCDAYIINKPNEPQLEAGLASIRDEVYAINKPETRSFVLELSNKTLKWDFSSPVENRSVEGWAIVNYDNPSTSDGILHLSGSQHYNHIRYNVPPGAIDPTKSVRAIIRVKNETLVEKARFYWWGSEATAAYLEFDITASDTEFKEYTVELGDDARWAGDINIIRFDMPSPIFETSFGKAIQIDYVELAADGPESNPVPDQEASHKKPFGVNLAGAEFGSNMPGTYNTDYTYPTTAELDYFKSKGLSLVRMPFKWERIQPSLNAPLDPAELQRIKTFVEAAEVRGVQVILDMHNYGRRKMNGTQYVIGDPALPVSTAADVWKKIANEFKVYDNIWAYGIMNEPHGMLPETPWFEIAQAVITEIRKSDVSTAILVGGDSWSSAERWPSASDDLKSLQDPSDNLIFEAHVYFDNDASGAYDQSYDGEGAGPNTGIDRVAPFVNWLETNGFEGFIGEYGVPDDDPRWLETLDNFLTYLAEKNVNGTYWAAGPWWGAYELAIEPQNGADRPQMDVLKKYSFAEVAGVSDKDVLVTHDWEFDEAVVNRTIEGWSIVNYDNPASIDGVLNLSGSQRYNNLNYVAQENNNIDPEVSQNLIVRLKNETDDTRARFYFWGSEASAAAIEFEITPNDNDFKEYTIDLSLDERWKGNIDRIRIDVPLPLTEGSYGKAIRIDHVKLTTQSFPTPDMPERDPAPFGVNMSGAEFGENIPGLFNTDYTYPNGTELDYFKSKGFSLYRVPFKWERIQKELNGPLDPDELIRLKNFVNAARAKGLWILLDMHNYGRRKINGTEYIIGDPQLSIASVADAWRKLADEFKSYDNIWGYGIMNEPHGMREDTPWFDIAQGIISEIRQTDTVTPIVVGGDSWSSAERWLSYSDNLKKLNDPSDNLIFEAHVYFDDDASGKYDQSYDAEGATANTGIGRVFPFVNWLNDNNLKGFVGEYGVPDDDARWLVTLDNLLAYLRANGVNGTYWSAGPWWHSYKLAVEPINGEDRPQMATLEKYLYADGEGEGEIPGGITNIWNFDEPVSNNKVEGWNIVNYSNASTTNGILSLTGEGTYNNLKYDVKASDAISPAISTQVIIKLKNETADTTARFYWWEPEVGNVYDYVEFNISPNDSTFHEYVLDLSDNEEWTNKPVLRIIRFDIPASLGAASLGRKISVDYIKLVAPHVNADLNSANLATVKRSLENGLRFSLFVNEARDIKARVDTPTAFQGQLTVDDMYGNRVFKIDCDLAKGRHVIDLEPVNFPVGVYIVTIVNSKGKSSKRFLIRY